MTIKNCLTNKEVDNCLSLLRQGRDDLVNLYTEKNSDIYHYSFRYANSSAAIGIVADLFDHLWLDSQIQFVKEKHSESEISDAVFRTFIKSVQKLSILNKSNSRLDGYDEWIITKIDALKMLLETKSRMDEKSRILEFDYYRDRVLWERELKKYENSIL